MTDDDLELIAEALAVVAAANGKTPNDKTVEGLSLLLRHIIRMEARVAAIEERGVTYKGVWQPSQQYGRGDLVTFDGSIFHANDVTRQRPNGAASGWTLAVKRGADGKDAERQRAPTAIRTQPGMRRP